MAEKLPSPPLTGIATKVVGESPEDRVKGVLKSEYAYLRENLSIDSEVAAKLFGWSPQLLGDPPYREILSFNERGKHFDAFERWYQFAESSYTEDRLKVFCECLAEIGSPTRPKLVEVGRRVFEMLVGEQMSGHGPSEHTDESGPSPSQLKSNEANVKVNPNPFLPPQFPPTGSSAAQGPSSQLLLGPSSGMPLPMPLQVPGAFPPGMGVPPGFGSQLMSVLQSLLGIPPTSTVSLAPSVSTEQRKDGENLKEVERTAAKMRVVRKLVLRGPSDYMTAVLHGVAASATIEDLKVEGLLSPDGGEHDVAEALAKCVVNPKLRIVETWSLPPLTVMKGLTTREVPLEELVISPIWRGDGEDLKEVERTAAKIRVVKKLVLLGPSNYMTAVLHGVAASATIEDLKVQGHPDDEEHDVAEALAKCVFNSKLRRVEMEDLPALPVMKALTTREVPLEELVIKDPPWGRGTVFSEDHLKEMERSAAKIRVRKVIFDVDYNTALHDAVSSGLGENKCLQDVTLRCVPEEKKQFVRSKLSAAGNPSCNVQLSSLTSENMSFSSPQRPPFHAHEAELKKLCWIPFGIQTLTVGEKGGLFPLQPQTTEVYKDDDVIALEVPEGAVNTAVCDRLCIRYGVIVFGPFDLPEGYQLGSMAVYIYFNQDHAVKPVVLHLPHWSGKDGESGLKCVVAPHRLEVGEEKYKFKDVKEGDFQSREGRSLITIDAHCSLFAKAFKDGFGLNYFATSLIQTPEKGLRAVAKIAVTHSSSIWAEILKEHRKGFKVEDQQTFSFEKEDVGVSLKLVEAKGPGWEANVFGYLLPKDIQYETYKIESPEQLKQAVKNNVYPPCLTCKVTSSREAKESGKHKDVKVVLEGTDRPTDHMGFTCPAYEEKAKERDTPIGMNSTPHQEPSAPTHMTGLSSSVDHTTSVSPTSSSPQFLLANRPSKELRVQHLMPYIPDLAPCGQGIAGYLGLTTAWASIEISLKDPPGRLQELLTKWLDNSEQETSPHSWEFFVDVVRKVGKGKLADRIVQEIFTEPQDMEENGHFNGQ